MTETELKNASTPDLWNMQGRLTHADAAELEQITRELAHRDGEFPTGSSAAQRMLGEQEPESVETTEPQAEHTPTLHITEEGRALYIDIR